MSDKIHAFLFALLGSLAVFTMLSPGNNPSVDVWCNAIAGALAVLCALMSLVIGIGKP